MDQESSKWLLEKNHPSKFTRYREQLANFDYEPIHIPGIKNKSDWISRYAKVASLRVEGEQKVGDYRVWEEVREGNEIFKKAQREDEFCRGANRILEQEQQEGEFAWGRLKFQRQHFEVKEGILYYLERIVIPETWVKTVLEEVHMEDALSSHQGFKRTWEIVKGRYYWATMREDVKGFVEECDRCNRNKRRLPFLGPLRRLEVNRRKFAAISVDLWGFAALPVVGRWRGVLSIIDSLTNFVQFIPLEDRRMETVVKALARGWIAIFVVPESIHADDEFCGSLKEAFCNYYRIKETFTGFYSPSQNGQVERVHGFLGEQVRMLGKEADWPEYVSFIAGKYNAGWCAAVNESPYFLVFGEDFRFNFERDSSMLRSIGIAGRDLEKLGQIAENAWTYRAEKFQEKLDQIEARFGTVREKEFLPGEVVWWNPRGINMRLSKFDKSLGPYRIKRIIGDNVLELDMIDGSNHSYVRASAQQLRPCYAEDGDV